MCLRLLVEDVFGSGVELVEFERPLGFVGFGGMRLSCRQSCGLPLPPTPFQALERTRSEVSNTKHQISNTNCQRFMFRVQMHYCIAMS